MWLPATSNCSGNKIHARIMQLPTDWLANQQPETLWIPPLSLMIAPQAAVALPCYTVSNTASLETVLAHNKGNTRVIPNSCLLPPVATVGPLWKTKGRLGREHRWFVHNYRIKCLAVSSVSSLVGVFSPKSKNNSHSFFLYTWRTDDEINTAKKQNEKKGMLLPTTTYSALWQRRFSASDTAKASIQIFLLEHQRELTAAIKQGGVFVPCVQGFLWCGIVFIKAFLDVFTLFLAFEPSQAQPLQRRRRKEVRQRSVTIVITPQSPDSHSVCSFCSNMLLS